MTRFATEPHRRHVGGVTWTRDAATGRYSAKVGDVLFEVLPVRSGRGGRSGPGGWDLLVEGRGLTGPNSWPISQLTRALQEASKLVRKERNKDDPYFRSPNVDPIEASRFRAARIRAEKDSSPMMNIAKLSEFNDADRQLSTLFLAWQAREMLGDAERMEEKGLHLRSVLCNEAAAMLSAALTLLTMRGRFPLSAGAKLSRTVELTERALAAAKAAFENGHIAMRYQESALTKAAPEWDKQHSTKAISIFKRATETARQETHRALVELCELFPGAMPTEE